MSERTERGPERRKGPREGYDVSCNERHSTRDRRQPERTERDKTTAEHLVDSGEHLHQAGNRIVEMADEIDALLEENKRLTGAVDNLQFNCTTYREKLEAAQGEASGERFCSGCGAGPFDFDRGSHVCPTTPLTEVEQREPVAKKGWIADLLEANAFGVTVEKLRQGLSERQAKAIVAHMKALHEAEASAEPSGLEQAMFSAMQKPKNLTHYGPDADGFWLVRRSEAIGVAIRAARVILGKRENLTAKPPGIQVPPTAQFSPVTPVQAGPKASGEPSGLLKGSEYVAAMIDGGDDPVEAAWLVGWAARESGHTGTRSVAFERFRAALAAHSQGDENDALLPCPFCGGEASMILGCPDPPYNEAKVECQNCGAEAGFTYNRKAETTVAYMATQAWNRREGAAHSPEREEVCGHRVPSGRSDDGGSCHLPKGHKQPCYATRTETEEPAP